MGTRLQLHSTLKELLGSENVYFQPPESISLCYPCIIYTWNDEATKFANNQPYNKRRGYQITVVSKNPDSVLPDKISASLPMCSFDRSFKSDNLNHTVYNIYY